MPYKTSESKRAWRERHYREHPELKEKALRMARERKESYRGTCRECGARTTGCNGPGSAPDLCHPCTCRLVLGPKMRGAGPQQARLIALLHREGELRFTEIRDRLGVTKEATGQLLHRLLKYGFIVRVRRGVYALPERERSERS